MTVGPIWVSKRTTEKCLGICDGSEVRQRGRELACSGRRSPPTTGER